LRGSGVARLESQHKVSSVEHMGSGVVDSRGGLVDFWLVSCLRGELTIRASSKSSFIANGRRKKFSFSDILKRRVVET
jgi:hypothetical protein